MKYQVFIDGVWQNSKSGETYSRVNPADPDEVLGEFQKGNELDAKEAIDSAENAFETWANTPAPKRAQYILKAGELLQSQKEDLSRMITREMGKTLRDSREDVQQAIVSVRQLLCLQQFVLVRQLNPYSFSLNYYLFDFFLSLIH